LLGAEVWYQVAPELVEAKIRLEIEAASLVPSAEEATEIQLLSTLVGAVCIHVAPESFEV
jgi:hypothetical protein